MSVRAMAYYLTAVVMGAVYGGQVCPLLEGLTPFRLGLIILAPVAVAYALRSVAEGPLMRRWPPVRHALVQFCLDLALFTTSGLAAALILRIGYGLGLLESGLKVFLSVFAMGIFAGLDLSLERERIVITAARNDRSTFSPPCRVFPITRKLVVVTTAIVALAATIVMLILVRDMRWLSEQGLSAISVEPLSRAVLGEMFVVMGVLLVLVVNLAFSYARNLSLLFANQTAVLESVSQGDLSRRVPVVTCDELGFIAAHTNTMITALRDGRRMSDGLRIAKEVQQNLLPDHAPALPGLELAGAALFSDETGGDFYDYIGCDEGTCGRIAVAVGDVSGHGIGAALLMAAGRALIRQSAASPGSPARNITTANRHLARDIDDTGRFMTLFFMILDPEEGTATWVNAGHQPPLVFDPASGGFSELRGRDIPLGVDQEWRFHQQTMPLPAPGQIILIGTDGLWEAHDRRDDMFGPDRVRQVIRDNAASGAEDILRALLAAVHEFVGANPQDDDITLVIIKGV
ncbi:Stage II sporulation protein E [Pseudodesulfovibrio aespoeensis Aspo-2]|uniref:Stage II sporulation protein E n=2 Tax=Pseudodesulfovibrio TaxID=2035811 RepID=E6VVU5_PSEA9|nr:MULTISPECIES: SpoIIE family protein phosphatase [Pseudodesulfovibrio]ADU61297.1 Stage II sporulation protein E [Pseudodesulfovibrio aespoeensis Aspo-2]